MLLSLALLVASGAAHAQIVIVHFKDEKAAKRYKKVAVESGDELIVIGEPIEGGGIRVDGTKINYTGGGPNELFLFNQNDPSDVPYKLKNGEKKLVRKKAKVSIAGQDIERFRFFSVSEDIHSLSVEYGFREGRLEELIAARKAHKKGSPEWFTAHEPLMLEYERLHSWLREVGFFGAAEKLLKTIKKEGKTAKGSAAAARRKTAEESVELVDTPDELAEKASGVSGSPTFLTYHSQHCRFYFPEGRWTEVEMEDAVTFAETVIDGFRVEFVDPYVSEDFKSRVPLGEQFIEFFFAPDANYVELFEGYFGKRFSDERSKEMGGSNFTRGRLAGDAPQSVRYIRAREGVDLASTVTYHLGDVLASLHFNGAHGGTPQPWIEQGVSYYLSFEYCGRNTWTSVDFTKGAYAKGARREGEKTVQLGLRAMFNEMAMIDGSRFDKLTLMSVAEMEDADFAKSWSFFDFVAKELGKEGQQWLRSACIHAKKKQTFHAKWRPESEALFDMEGKDVLRELEERWKAYAEGQQDISEDGRK